MNRLYLHVFETSGDYAPQMTERLLRLLNEEVGIDATADNGLIELEDCEPVASH